MKTFEKFVREASVSQIEQLIQMLEELHDDDFKELIQVLSSLVSGR